MPERVDDAAAFNYCAIARDLGRARVHGRPRRRHVSGPDGPQRTREPARGPRRLRGARHPRDPLPGAVGADRARATSTRRTGAGRTSGWAGCASSASRPIVGLVHHGSGPRHTEPARPRLRAEARRRSPARVAERYPWVDMLHAGQRAADHGAVQRRSTATGTRTPATTVRSARARSTSAGRACSRCGRSAQVNPAARLVQTEDLGRTYSTPRARATRPRFENQRRWLSLGPAAAGASTGEHPLRRLSRRRRRRRGGAGAGADDPCPPDIVGVNHYLTSERWLDHRMERYPAARTAATARDRYVDVEAARVPGRRPTPGSEPLLREAWERYRLPVAVTEAHIGCTREEQLRWLREVWHAARGGCGSGRRRARGHGVGAARQLRLEQPR